MRQPFYPLELEAASRAVIDAADVAPEPAVLPALAGPHQKNCRQPGSSSPGLPAAPRVNCQRENCRQVHGRLSVPPAIAIAALVVRLQYFNPLTSLSSCVVLKGFLLSSHSIPASLRQNLPLFLHSEPCLTLLKCPGPTVPTPHRSH